MVAKDSARLPFVAVSQIVWDGIGWLLVSVRVPDAALECSQRSRRKVVRRPTDNIDYHLKLPCHDVMNGAGFADQQHRHRNCYRAAQRAA